VTVDKPEAEEQTPPPSPVPQTQAGWQKTIDDLIAKVMSIRIVKAVMDVLDTAGQAGAGLFAAALAFSTLFALFPLLLLMAGVLGWLIEDPVQREALLQQLISYFPPIESLLKDSLDTMVQQRAALTIVGTVGLFWGASGFYLALDEVMRRLFAGAAPRDFVVNRLRGIAMVFILIALMVGTLVITSVIGIITGITGQDQLLRVVTPIAALFVLILVVLAIYMLIPAAPPSLRAALPAAIVAGLGIGLFTQLFGILTPWLVGGLLAFGVVATVFAALIWLNLSYQMLLYGAAWARIRRDAEIRRGESASASTPYAS
jgi:membrane protein